MKSPLMSLAKPTAISSRPSIPARFPATRLPAKSKPNATGIHGHATGKPSAKPRNKFLTSATFTTGGLKPPWCEVTPLQSPQRAPQFFPGSKCPYLDHGCAPAGQGVYFRDSAFLKVHHLNDQPVLCAECIQQPVQQFARARPQRVNRIFGR